MPMASTGRIRSTLRTGMPMAVPPSATMPPMTATQPAGGM